MSDNESMNRAAGPLAGYRVIDLDKAEIGADTQSVLEEIGYTPDEVARLAAEGVVKAAAPKG
jgi:crotonobetainyl-CoA:carnitine CoA-transferase CaiB-like acyl-CoA transferase